MSSRYGEFDPKFPGVSLHVDSPAAWERITRYALGPDTPELAGTHTAQEFLDRVSSVSVLIHELRHFHDFLISDFGCRVVRARLQVVLNMLQVVVNLGKLGAWERANVVLTPLTDWCRLDPGRRERELAALNWAGADLRPPELPYFAADWAPLDPRLVGPQPVGAATLARQLNVCGVYQERIRRLHGKPEGTQDFDYYPQQFAEASALLCQTAEISGAWDDETAVRFVNAVLESRSRYATALDRTLRLFRMAETPVVSAFLCWCMFGDYSAGDQAYPVHRYAALGDRLMKDYDRVVPAKTPRTRREWLRLFERWDGLAGLPSTVDGLRASVRESRASFAKVKERIAETDLNELYTDFVAGIGQVLTARDYMVDCFLSDPGAYLHPVEYRHNMAHWTAAPLKYTLAPDLALQIPHEQEWNLYAYRVDEAGRKLVGVSGPRKPLTGVEHIDPEAAFTVYNLTSVADVLIGPSPPDVTPLDRQLTDDLLGVRTVPLIL